MKRERNEGDEELEMTGEDNFTETELEDVEESTDSKLASLLKILKASEEEKRQYLEDLQRARADFLIIKKHLKEEKTRQVARAIDEHAAKLLPLCDSFVMAMNDKSTWEGLPENWRVGMEGIYNQLLGLLSSYSISVLNPVGQEFDPNQHEAVSNVPVDEKEEGKVISVLQNGYIRKTDAGDIVIRPARVTVGEAK